MQVNEYIVIDPEICNGRPTISGSRITVQTILEFLAAGESIESIMAEYPKLTAESIQACLQFASELTSHEYSVYIR